MSFFIPPLFLAIFASPVPEDPPDLQRAGDGLEVEWQSRAGHTYSLQQAETLEEWETLPYVFEGDDGPIRFRLPPPWPMRFVRLRSSTDGDTDGDLLPDAWEWRTFGDLDAEAAADPDGDGRSNLEEYRDETPPLDFYNGGEVLLTVHSAATQSLAPGAVAPDALHLSLRDPAGEPWAHAPVRFLSFSGNACFAHAGTRHAELTLFTDANGEIHPGTHNLRIRAPELPDTLHRLLVEAGGSRHELELLVMPGDAPSPPRQLRRADNHDGSVTYSWQGAAEGAERIFIEERNEHGAWETVLDLPRADWPAPDPATGRYAVTVANPNP